MASNATFNGYQEEKQQRVVSLMLELFCGHPDLHGFALLSKAMFNEEKRKHEFRSGGVSSRRTALTPEMLKEHLSGGNFYGSIPLRPGNTVYYVCLDVDGVEGTKYEFLYEKEMARIKASRYPLVVFRTKSGGLRVVLFFNQEVSAKLGHDAISRIGSQLGYTRDCEVFPKQTEIKDESDFPNWIFLPFGPDGDLFPEQCCMDWNGNPRDICEALEWALTQRIDETQLRALFNGEEATKAQAKTTRKRRQQGKFNEEETVEKTAATLLYDGPPCLFQIGMHGGCAEFRNNYLYNCAVLVKRKYPENWEEALTWANAHLIKPPLPISEVQAMIKSHKNKQYQYKCKEDPIVSHCHSHACKNQTFGVGTNGGLLPDLAMTILMRQPRIYYMSINGKRCVMPPTSTVSMQAFYNACESIGIHEVPIMKRSEFLPWMNEQKAKAVLVEPSELMRTHAEEIEILGAFFNSVIPSRVLSQGDVYREGKFEPEQGVRMRLSEQRIYFKLRALKRHYDAHQKHWGAFITWLDNGVVKHHGHTEPLGRWYRHTYSVSFDLFEPHIIEEWVYPKSAAELARDEDTKAESRESTDP